MRFSARVLRVAACAVLIAAGCAGFPATAAAEAGCHPVGVPASIAGGASGTVSGTLCAPPGARTVQLLIHGFTYGQYYWDFPYRPEEYSYVRAANSAGYATLDIDRLGTSPSFRPPSAEVTIESNAEVVHQVVTALRNGSLGAAFAHVVLVGDSYGSFTSYVVAGKFGGVDAIVATGASHKANLLGFGTEVMTRTVPALLDPKFAGQALDPGYVTTLPGARSVFYGKQADPQVVAVDEQDKQPGAVTEFVTYLQEYLATATRNVDLPVLTVNGSEDPFVCGLLCRLLLRRRARRVRKAVLRAECRGGRVCRGRGGA